MTRELQPSDYQHTRVLGFSVTNSLWSSFYAAIPNPSNWELLWYSGGSVDIWADPNSDAWLGNHTVSGALINGLGGATDPTANTSTIDRVILNVSGMATGATDPVTNGARPNLSLTSHDQTGYPPGGYCGTVSDWVAYIGATVANIRAKYTSVRMILLQPNIGGASLSMTSCTTQTSNSAAAGYDNQGAVSPSGPWSAGFGVVRCTYTSPYIRSAIASLTRGNVRGGFGASGACSDFVDWAGHLFSTGSPSPQTSHGQAMAAYYASTL